MNPLFEKYFHGELDEAEEDNLEALLQASEEQAWEFGRAAEETYRGYGLPDPGDGAVGSGVSKLWLLLLLPLLFVGWKLLGGGHGTPAPSAVVSPPIQVPTPIPTRAPERRVAAPPKAPTPTAISQPPPMAAPPAAGGETAAGNNLRVVVKREAPGPVTVRVSDATGTEVRRLYEGNLGAGRWAFEWDGRSQDGRLVAPGNYRIEVTSEGVVQSRNVEIH